MKVSNLPLTFNLLAVNTVLVFLIISLAIQIPGATALSTGHVNLPKGPGDLPRRPCNHRRKRSADCPPETPTDTDAGTALDERDAKHRPPPPPLVCRGVDCRPATPTDTDAGTALDERDAKHRPLPTPRICRGADCRPAAPADTDAVTALDERNEMAPPEKRCWPWRVRGHRRPCPETPDDTESTIDEQLENLPRADITTHKRNAKPPPRPPGPTFCWRNGEFVVCPNPGDDKITLDKRFENIPQTTAPATQFVLNLFTAIFAQESMGALSTTQQWQQFCHQFNFTQISALGLNGTLVKETVCIANQDPTRFTRFNLLAGIVHWATNLWSLQALAAFGSDKNFTKHACEALDVSRANVALLNGTQAQKALCDGHISGAEVAEEKVLVLNQAF